MEGGRRVNTPMGNKANQNQNKKPTYANPDQAGKRKANSAPTQQLQKGTKKRKGVKQKVKKKERQAKKKNHDIITDTKHLWETVRRKDLPQDERKPLVDKLMQMCAGKVMEVLHKHDGSRVIQTLLKYGTIEQRAKLFQELSGNLINLSKSTYSRHLVMKLMSYGTKEQKEKCLKEFQGKVRQLVKHKEASEVLEYAYSEIANGKQRAALVSEFYGPQYALFHSDEFKTLGDFLKAKPEQKPMVMKYLSEIVHPVVEKGLLSHSIVHRVVLEYLMNADVGEMRDMITSLREQVVHILHTKDGAHIGVWCATYGSPKDRKAMIKTFKGVVSKICMEEYGHLVLLRILDVTDDTVLLRKAIFGELFKDKEGLLNILTHKYGRQSFLHVLAPLDTRYFQPQVISLLQPAYILLPGATQPQRTSKKQDEVRRGELLGGLLQDLVSFVVADIHTTGEEEAGTASSSTSTKPGHVLHTLILSVQGGPVLHEFLVKYQGEKKVEILEALASLCVGTEEDNIINNFNASRILKHLIKDVDGFAQILLEKVSGNLLHWALKKGSSYIVTALLEHPQTYEQASKELAGHEEELKNNEGRWSALVLKLMHKQTTLNHDDNQDDEPPPAHPND